MPSSPKPAATDRTVRYGGWLFSAPAAFAAAIPPNCAGIYAIQAMNPTWTPCPFEPIYFGFSTDLKAEFIGPSHPAFGRWIAHPRAGTGLYLSYAALPCTGQGALRHIVHGLVMTYRPSANADNGPARGLLGLAG